jgi:hypothetical protein
VHLQHTILPTFGSDIEQCVSVVLFEETVCTAAASRSGFKATLQKNGARPPWPMLLKDISLCFSDFHFVHLTNPKPHVK